MVHKMTALLAKHRLNIDQMKTSQQEAPHGGTTLFSVNGVVTSPAPLASGFDISKIEKELFELGDELNCDVNLESLSHDEYDEAYSGSFYAGWAPLKCHDDPKYTNIAHEL